MTKQHGTTTPPKPWTRVLNTKKTISICSHTRAWS